MTRMINNPRVFEVHFSYLEPQRASVQIAAESPDHAESIIREHPALKDALQLEISHIMDIGPYQLAQPVFDNDNIIQFPTKKDLN